MNLSTVTSIVKWTLVGIGVVVLAVTIFVAVVVTDSSMPTLEMLENPPQELATQVLSADGVLLDHFATTRRTYAPFDSIPKSFINALVATEDRAFYRHWGVHSMRIIKAAIKNVASMRAREGASTITQQLARNLYFTNEQTLTRKIREAWTAFQIERTYTKNEILEMYSNTVYYGRGAYGIRVAAEVYFNKQPMDLTTAECAYLVGLFKAPERYGTDDSLGVQRRNLILALMHEEGFLTADEYAAASLEPLTRPARTAISRGIAPHFVEMIRQQLTRSAEDDDSELKGFNLYRDGLVIHTTLDSRIQRYANEAVEAHMAEVQAMFDRTWSWKNNMKLLNALVDRAAMRHPAVTKAKQSEREAALRKLRARPSFVDSVKRMVTTVQTGLVILDHRTGAILAMVGASPQAMRLDAAGRYSLNHVTQIRRQPGSSFKPFVYASAINEGLHPDAEIESGPFSWRDPSTGQVWSPAGASKDGGPMSLRAALKFSTNTVAARLITEYTTPTKVADLCRRAGITTPLAAVPSIALGATEVSPMELTSAYGIFGNEGVHVPPTAITRIEDRMGNVLMQTRLPRMVNDAVSPTVANVVLSLMRGVVDGGTGSRVRRYFRYDAAGKTGTTNDNADAWFVGLTPQLTCGIWVGFDDRRVQFVNDEGQGGRAAAPLWGRVMQKVYADPSLPYRQRTFNVAKDSSDVVDADALRNPPSERMRDDQPDSSRSTSQP
jgi:penicillin-binding protein 1A